MKISREIQLGLLAIIVVAGMIWGYKFVIGQNLLKPSRTFYVDYEDVTALAVSSPVTLNGYSVGSVVGIDLNKQDVKKMRVTLKIEDTEIKFTKDTRAVLASEGLVGGKYIALEFDENCNGSNCAQDGDVLVGKISSLLSTFVQEDELQQTVGTVADGLVTVLDSLGADGRDGSLNNTIRNLEVITNNLADLTKTTAGLMRNSQTNLQSTLSNVDQITGVIAQDRERISNLMANLDSITGSLAKADMGRLVENSNTAIVQTSDAIKEFEKTLATTESTMTQLSSVLTKIETGDGSLSKLLSDEQLYTNLEFTSRNLALLLQDVRLNPGRYISVSVFGKDKKEYTPANEDPAFEGEWEIKRVKKGN